ncbi:Serine/threonine-protein phosphatase 6 regulatory ankyrin repeat subunit B (PP6-ARS-B) (Serine/threonine-protein phosphatase 6 regulatory subunit ARS-B) (Ankyrin repeat domain-containing protein 44), partial [Durusdinium trenchii]
PLRALRSEVARCLRVPRYKVRLCASGDDTPLTNELWKQQGSPEELTAICVDFEELLDLYAAELLEAVAAGELEEAEDLLGRGQQPDVVDPTAGSALCIAARDGQEEILEMLLEAQADVNGVQALFPSDDRWSIEKRAQNHLEAASEAHLSCLAELLAQRCAVDTEDLHGRTALHKAASLEGTEAHLELLLSAGARVASLNRRRQAPLHLCTTKAQVLRLLAARGELELKDSYGSSALLCACDNGRAEVVQELLKQRASLQLRNRRAESALQLAARKGHLKIAELLLDAQIDVNTTDKDGTSPLCVALTGGFQDFAALLLAHQADADLPDSRGRNVFCVAAENDRLKVLQLLLPVLPADAAPLLRRDIFGRTALYAAAERGHAEAVELLLAAKSEVQVLDHNHRSLLHAAALAHSSHCLEQLLDARVAVDVADREGRTALHVAAEGEEELVE